MRIYRIELRCRNAAENVPSSFVALLFAGPNSSWDISLAFWGNICLHDAILFVSMCICTFSQTLWWFRVLSRSVGSCPKTFRYLITKQKSERWVQNWGKAGKRCRLVQFNLLYPQKGWSCSGGNLSDGLGCPICVTSTLAFPWMDELGGQGGRISLVAPPALAVSSMRSITPPLIPYWFGIPEDNQVFSRLSQAALRMFYVSIPAQWFVRQVLCPWLKTIAQFCWYSRKHRVKYSLIYPRLLV